MDNTTLQPITPPTGFTGFISPLAGQLSVDPHQTFQWAAVAGAAYYQLQVGTTRGGTDIFDSGPITATSIAVPSLPAAGVVYARVRMIPEGWSTALPAGDFPRGTYATFRMDSNVSGATFANPASSGATVDADTPIEWQNDPLATAYELKLTRANDGTFLVDTGMIQSTLRVVTGIASGTVVNAELTTYYTQGIKRTQTTQFVVGTSTTHVAAMFGVARQLTASVREMADLDQQPYDNTPLLAYSLSTNQGASSCVAFAQVLLVRFQQANFPLQTQQRDICFNYPDCHELVEIYDPDQQRWSTLDPTFGLYTLNSAGQPATAQEISAAARAGAFGTLSFSFLTPQGNAYARGYYLDYPLLWLNLYTLGSNTNFEQPPPASLEPYLDLMGSATNGVVSNYYTVQCAAGYSSNNADWDGTVREYPCTNGYTQVFWGIDVQLVPGDGSAAAIWRMHRFVF